MMRKSVLPKLIVIAAVLSALVFVAPISPVRAASVTENITTEVDATVDYYTPDTNYGNGIYLDVGNFYDDPENHLWRTFIKFDLSDIVGTITEAKLYLYLHIKYDPIWVEVWGSSNTDWGESTVTWNNQPELTTFLDESYAETEEWQSWDVTSWVEGKEGEKITLALKRDYEDIEDNNFADYDSSEFDYHPYLEITYTPATLTSQNFYPSDDAYTFARFPDSTNNTSQLQTNYPNIIEQYETRTFLKFDISGAEDVFSAHLYLCFWNGYTDYPYVYARRVGNPPYNDVWSENTLTWANMEPNNLYLGATEDTVTITSTTQYHWEVWDVTSWVENQQDTDNVVTIAITGGYLDAFLSKEGGGSEYRPYLKIYYISNQPPVVENLKTQGQINPINLPYAANPVFSWDYFDNDNDQQMHYEVWVGTSSGAKDKWDSGQVASSAENATYTGSGLETGVTYYVRVRVEDGANWSSWTTGTFKMSASYGIILRWEENNEEAIENATLKAYMRNYGTQEDSIVDGVLDNVAYPERPYWLKLTYENYWRGRVPTTDNGTMTFWITASPTLYNFTLNDLVGGYGPPNGTLHIDRWIGENYATISSDYWAPDLVCSAFLMFGEKYQIYVEGPNRPKRYIGDITMTLTKDHIIQVSAVDEELALIYNYVYWAAWRENNIIRAEYQDNLKSTLTASVKIYHENGDLAVLPFQPDNEWFIVTWPYADENESYNVVLEVSHGTYGDFTISTPIGSTVGPPGAGGTGNPFGLPSGLTMAGLGSIILVTVVGLAFDSLRVQLGMLAIAMTTLFCWYMRFLPLPGPYGGAFTATLIFIMAVLFAITWRRYR